MNASIEDRIRLIEKMSKAIENTNFCNIFCIPVYFLDFESGSWKLHSVENPFIYKDEEAFLLHSVENTYIFIYGNKKIKRKYLLPKSGWMYNFFEDDKI